MSGEKLVFPGGDKPGKKEPPKPGEEGFVYTCPLLSASLPQPPQITGGAPGLAMIEGGCIGERCGFYSRKRQRCGVGD